jgi:hypothetical protein
MLSRKDFAQRVLVGGAGLVAATTLVPTRPALAAGQVGNKDHLHVIGAIPDPDKPIVETEQFESFYGGSWYAAGPISFTIEKSGDWIFTVNLTDGKLYQETKQFMKLESYLDLGIVVGCKDSIGTTIGWQITGKYYFGKPYLLSKTGNSKIIKENWKYFAAGHSYYGEGTGILTAVSAPSSGGGGGVDVGGIIKDVGGVVGTIAALF